MPSRWHALGHTRLVFLGKRILLGLTVLLVLGLIAVAWMNQRSGGRLVLEATAEGDAPPVAPVMAKPRYQGVDARLRPFTVTAERATDEGRNVYRLFVVTADLAPGTRDWMALTGASAVYHADEERLEFSDGVSFTNDAGYLFTTPSLTVTVKDRTATGTQPVEGTGVGGTLRADRFEVLDGGDKILFYSNVRVTIYRKPRG